MAEQIQIQINSSEVSAILRQYAERTGNLTAPLETIGATLKSKVQMGFRLSQSTYGDSWKPLTPYWKYSGGAKRWREGQPLRDTGRLMNSFTYQVNQNEVVIGTNVEYARTHQDGLNGVTKREFFPNQSGGLPVSWRLAIINNVRQHLEH